MKTLNANHNIIDTVCKKIAPLWPLESFVAVNPYRGMADQNFDDVAHYLQRVAGASSTLPLSFYREAFIQGKIEPSILDSVIQSYSQRQKTDIADQEDLWENPDEKPVAKVPLVMDLANETMGKEWKRLAVDRITNWASSYFDDGQMLWNPTASSGNLYQAWRLEASHDMTCDVMGLKGFRDFVRKLPICEDEAVEKCLTLLDIPKHMKEIYLHSLVMTFGGWGSYVARLDWDAELEGRQGQNLHQFIVILVCWEAALLATTASETIAKLWKQKMTEFAITENQELNKTLSRQLILQEAYDQTAQKRLIDQFRLKKKKNPENSTAKTLVQAIFCIDVRSEVFRRKLESTSSQIETLGFAGFFAFPVSYQALGHEKSVAQCPVLLTTTHNIKEAAGSVGESTKISNRRQISQHVRIAWKNFKLGAISCFSFVGPVGLAYLPKLFSDAFGWTRPVPHPDRAGWTRKDLSKKNIELKATDFSSGIPLQDRIEMSKNALKAMSLTSDFAPVVLITGHGSSTVNNPHATGLDCGACGGRTGEANAKVAAAVLNDPEVRVALEKEDIKIPDTTWFIACLHDTTTDEVTLYNETDIPDSHTDTIFQIKEWLREAARLARLERSARMEGISANRVDTSIVERSKDWSQVRPEWGLAGCSSFVVAPRERTRDLDLQGRTFLHSYSWEKDDGFAILELIMTAPMVVASWISLQYFASTVDNKVFGSGNKTLHNVVGGIGVLEGYTGDLRVGLPWQSVHDGQKYQHEPVKLNVIIEAPVEAINQILARHADVRDLCENNWLHLLAMDAHGQVNQRYAGDLKWEQI